VRRPPKAGAPQPRMDHTGELEDEPRAPRAAEAAEDSVPPPAPPATPAERAFEAYPPAPPVVPEEAPARFTEPAPEPAPPPAPAWPDEPRYEPEELPAELQQPPYEYGPYDGGYQAGAYAEEPRGAGFGPIAAVAVVALALMAIGLGAILSGVFSGTASSSPTASAQASLPPTPLPTPLATAVPSESVAPSLAPTPTPTAGPVVFADGFTAEAQPCADQPNSFSGCDSSGSTVSGTAIWVWVGFHKGNDADVITANVIDAGGTTIKDGSVSLSAISCGSSCNGWLRFRFTGLTAGSYGIRIDRNGEFAAASSFTISG